MIYEDKISSKKGINTLIFISDTIDTNA